MKSYLSAGNAERKNILGALALIASCLLSGWVKAETASEHDAEFYQWLEQLRNDAAGQGISEKTLDQAFTGITPPVKRIIKNDRSQAEVVETYDHYLSRRLSDWKKSKGRKLAKKHRDVLQQVADKYGVQPRFLLAIWGMETNYGSFPLKESAFNVLATLAYDKRRGAYFRKEFLAALKMLDSGFPTMAELKSSWAGALGQPQFMPTSYLEYAQDFNGDGKKDIWNTEADVFASIAHYFKVRGWRNDQTWGRPVSLPPGGEAALMKPQGDGLTPDADCKRFKTMGAWRDLKRWQELGVRRADGSDLPDVSIPAALIVADKGDKRGYIVYRNFCTLMSFNPAFKYALSIGLLSDALKD
ncbi:lytic murein transglycosylase [Gilvimarinus agarilyticus]|uniref:lytic murein transglycosylase n=1 Tax=unclassified Gilvimarinus TaxID=2642066 RepID=UPI001C08505C|nr:MULTISPECIES: lytic murein transglycosylase [unclassified Gilvimarinus]MBU2884150.1 lytic murein transglycosylase [Gilvimarinus agarilyticus]MDO6569322.1 lytic murein transglycosylase [Gilvimarinus sp. 2_MG-2023]MDO6747069.1 lytic murein transglycosylase [Gilvimarinus sp. 1_MG-2023]